MEPPSCGGPGQLPSSPPLNPALLSGRNRVDLYTICCYLNLAVYATQDLQDNVGQNYLRSSVTGILYSSLVSLFSGRDFRACRVFATSLYQYITLREMSNMQETFVRTLPGIAGIKTFKG